MLVKGYWPNYWGTYWDESYWPMISTAVEEWQDVILEGFDSISGKIVQITGRLKTIN